VKTVLADTFFGPPNTGVYSPSVQNTLYLMAKATLNRLFVSLLSLHLTDILGCPLNATSSMNLFQS